MYPCRHGYLCAHTYTHLRARQIDNSAVNCTRLYLTLWVKYWPVQLTALSSCNPEKQAESHGMLMGYHLGSEIPMISHVHPMCSLICLLYSAGYGCVQMMVWWRWDLRVLAWWATLKIIHTYITPPPEQLVLCTPAQLESEEGDASFLVSTPHYWKNSSKNWIIDYYLLLAVRLMLMLSETHCHLSTPWVPTKGERGIPLTYPKGIDPWVGACSSIKQKVLGKNTHTCWLLTCAFWSQRYDSYIVILFCYNLSDIASNF